MSFVRDAKKEAEIREIVEKIYQEATDYINENKEFDKEQRAREKEKLNYRKKFDIDFQIKNGPQPLWDPENRWSKALNEYIYKKMQQVYKDDPTLLSDDEVHSKLVQSYTGADEDFEFWHEIDQMRRGNPEARWQQFNQTLDQIEDEDYQEKMQKEREATLKRQAEWKKIWAKRAGQDVAHADSISTIKKAKNESKTEVKSEPDKSALETMRKLIFGY